MSMTNKSIVSLIAGGTLALTAVPLAAAAPAANPYADARGTTVEREAAARSTVAAPHQVTIANIQGTFSWNQGVTTDNNALAKALYRSSAHLCGTGANSANANPATAKAARTGNVTPTSKAASEANQTGPIETIEVSGDVHHAFTASVSELSSKAPVKKVMGCTCGGNPADGRASANAAVEGFQLSALIDEANPEDGANTITFVSRDGYRVALPLSYVQQRYSIVVTNINGEQTSEAIGCSNQLWLGSTSARSFARDVVAIEITSETTAPAVPGAPAEANLPNVGVVAGSASQ